MGQTVFVGDQARRFIPEIGDNNAKVITPVVDTLFSNQRLGHIIIYKGYCHKYNNKKIYSTMITKPQEDVGIKGSFIFIGSNANLFNHLFNNTFSGKIINNGIIIDSEFKGMISFEFVTILKDFLAKYV